jgi:hypothetical protein
MRRSRLQYIAWERFIWTYPEERKRVLRTKLSEVLPLLNEKQRCVLAASEADGVHGEPHSQLPAFKE